MIYLLIFILSILIGIIVTYFYILIGDISLFILQNNKSNNKDIINVTLAKYKNVLKYIMFINVICAIIITYVIYYLCK